MFSILLTSDFPYSTKPGSFSNRELFVFLFQFLETGYYEPRIHEEQHSSRIFGR